MITDFIFSFFRSAFDFVLGLLPSWNPVDLSGASGVAGFTSGMISMVDWLDWYVPAKLAMSLLLGMWGYQAAVYLFNAVVWAATKLHLLGGE